MGEADRAALLPDQRPAVCARMHAFAIGDQTELRTAPRHPLREMHSRKTNESTIVHLSANTISETLDHVQLKYLGIAEFISLQFHIAQGRARKLFIMVFFLLRREILSCDIFFP